MSGDVRRTLTQAESEALWCLVLDQETKADYSTLLYLDRYAEGIVPCPLPVRPRPYNVETDGL